jgi:hypothetical protein
MRKSIFVSIAVTVTALLGTLAVATHRPREKAVWDFAQSRASSIVGWPTDKTWSGRDWWSPHNYHYEDLTISLPNRPRLLSIAPPNVFFDRKGGQLISIQINEEPVTQVQALDRLRRLAKEWGWPWNDADYARWVKRSAQNDRSSIGAGDRWDSTLVPRVDAGIYPVAGTPDRPWYVRISINWPESLPPPYGTAK